MQKPQRDIAAGIIDRWRRHGRLQYLHYTNRFREGITRFFHILSLDTIEKATAFIRDNNIALSRGQALRRHHGPKRQKKMPSAGRALLLQASYGLP